MSDLDTKDREPDASRDEARGASPAPRSDEPSDLGRKAAGAVAGGASAAGRTLREGYSAMVDVHRAAREHSAARSSLEELRRETEERQAELAHREDVEGRYDELVAELEGRIKDAEDELSATEGRIAELEGERDDLSAELKEMKERHEREIRPYRELMESAQGRAEDAAKLLSEAKRSAKNAETQLNGLTERRDSRISALNRSAENSKARLEELNSNLERIKADPDAKPEAAGEVEAAIMTEQAHLEEAQRKVDEVADEMKRSVDSAQTHLWTQRKSVEEAERANDAAKAEAQIRREDHDKMRQDAETDEAVLDNAIIEREMGLRDANQERDAISERLEADRAELDDARDIHATPERTRQVRDQIVENQASMEAKQREVDDLAATERSLRESTRGQRGAFMGVVVAAALVVVLLVWLIFLR